MPVLSQMAMNLTPALNAFQLLPQLASALVTCLISSFLLHRLHSMIFLAIGAVCEVSGATLFFLLCKTIFNASIYPPSSLLTVMGRDLIMIVVIVS